MSTDLWSHARRTGTAVAVLGLLSVVPSTLASTPASTPTTPPAATGTCVYHPAGPLLPPPPTASLCPPLVDDQTPSNIWLVGPWTRTRPYCQRHLYRFFSEKDQQRLRPDDPPPPLETDTFCLYLAPHFRAPWHSGFALITSPEVAASLAGSYMGSSFHGTNVEFEPPQTPEDWLAEPAVCPAFVHRHATVPGPVVVPGRGPAYELRHMKDKGGLGAVALRDIKQGEVFMSDFPSLLVSRAWLDGRSPPEGEGPQGGAGDGDPTMEGTGAGVSGGAGMGGASGSARWRMLRRAVRSLPREGRRRVMALARRTHPRKEQDDEEEDEEVTGEVVEDIMGTNANTVILEGEPHAGLFAEFSRLNHACSPNAFYRFVPQRLTLDVIAYRDIEAGEEITINYAPLGLPFAARQEHIRATWAFHCTCPLCSKLSANPELIPESDARRARLVAGRHEMAAAYSQGDVLHSLGLAAELRKLSEQEGMNPIAAEYDELLAGMRLEGGDIWAADVIGRRAMAEWAKFTGADSWENVRRVREWMADEIEAGYDR